MDAQKKTLGKLKLNQFSKNELGKRQMKVLKGGGVILVTVIVMMVAAFTQKGTVKGVMVDGKTSEVLMYATVVIEGTTARAKGILQF